MVADSYAGVTMGAWFRPDAGAAACAEQPVVCINQACPAAPNGTSAAAAAAPPAPFPLAYLCLVYVDGKVHLLSDSNTTAPGSLFGYSNASVAAKAGEWHYASVTVEAGV